MTEQERQWVRSAALGVWDYIGYDCLQMSPNQLMTRDAVLEVVVDADRLSDELRQRGHAALAQTVADMPYSAVRKLLLPAFPYSRYGM